MDIEKRKFPRQLVSLSTNLLETETEKVLGDCILTDISKVGFAFESETNFHIGQKFNLELVILNQNISLSGKIVRICDGVFYKMYGVEIIDGDSKNLDFFRRYIDYSLN